MTRPDLPAEFRKYLHKERRDSRAAAHAFATACRDGTVDAFYEAVDMLNVTTDSWRPALATVSKLPSVSPG